MRHYLRRTTSFVRLLQKKYPNSNIRCLGDWTFRIALLLFIILCGFAWYQRTINLWALKNIGDTFIHKDIGTRQIVLGAFWREKDEQNVKGRFAVVHFLGDVRMEHPVYCFSKQPDNRYLISHATVQRIHKGKRANSDVCSWAGHIAECEVEPHAYREFRMGTTLAVEDSFIITPEAPIKEKKHDLVVCMAPMYMYTDWEILLAGIETWMALGATKIVVPIQSASTTTYKILKEYEKLGIVIIRHWPKWPVLSDVNPNGLVLSRGIEESHVNCLFFVKPFADLVVFTDIDDMLLPNDPTMVSKGINLKILRSLFAEHPQAGSLLFEHRDVQFSYPENQNKYTLSTFNFDFLQNSRNKMNCNVWRMKTRVAVNASRVDSVNMHETGIHRFGYVQTRVPCRQAHFYHLRHSHAVVPSPTPIDMSPLSNLLNERWGKRLEASFGDFKYHPLNKTDTASLKDFDRCMGAINDEHYTLKVSRCLTPHVCYSRIKRNIDCMAVAATYEFFRSGSGYIILPNNVSAVSSTSLSNCDAPLPTYTSGNHYFAP